MKCNFNSFDELPVMLTVPQVAEVLGVSKTSAYELAHSDGFPSIALGTRLIVPRDKFLKWIDEQSEK